MRNHLDQGEISRSLRSLQCTVLSHCKLLDSLSAFFGKKWYCFICFMPRRSYSSLTFLSRSLVQFISLGDSNISFSL